MQIELIRTIQTFRTPFLDSLFQAITITGEESFFIVVICIFIWCIDKRFGFKLGFICLTSSILNVGLKEVFHTARPIGYEGVSSLRVETATGYAFPSGHTQASASFWIPMMLRMRKRLVYIAGIMTVLGVAISRLYLGVHWPVDVIGGVIIGIVWALIAGRWFGYVVQARDIKVFLAIAAISAVGVFIFNDPNYVKACGALSGFLLGYYVEGEYIHYSVSEKIPVRILEFVLGFSILVAIKIGFKEILPAGNLSNYMRYCILVFWITAGAPYVFNKLPFRKRGYAN